MNLETRKLVRRMNSQRLASAARATRAATTSPARTSGVSIALITRRMAATKTIVRHASPNSNLRLNSMLLHAPVERPPAETELGSGQGNVEMVHSKCALDHLVLELVEVERFARADDESARLSARRQREVLGPIQFALGHDHGPFRGM